MTLVKVFREGKKPSYVEVHRHTNCPVPDCPIHNRLVIDLHLYYYGRYTHDSPVKYNSGKIEYGWPERMPKYAMKLVERAYRYVEERENADYREPR